MSATTEVIPFAVPAQATHASHVSRELEAVTPKEEYEAQLGEAVVWEEYTADKGARS